MVSQRASSLKLAYAETENFQVMHRTTDMLADRRVFVGTL